MPSRQPKKDRVIFIAIKKEKAVTLCTLLPYVYDSYLLIYGRPGSFPRFFPPNSDFTGLLLSLAAMVSKATKSVV